MSKITEYTVNPDEIYLDDVAELAEGLNSTDFRRINAVLVRCVTDVDGKPIERIKASHAVKLATRILEAVNETTAGN